MPRTTDRDESEAPQGTGATAAWYSAGTTVPKLSRSAWDSEARFQAIFDSTTRGLLLFDHEGAPQTANAAFLEMFGFNANSALSTEAIELRFVSGRQIFEFREQLRGCLEGVSDPSDVMMDIRQLGAESERHLSSRCNPLSLGDGTRGVLVEFTERTEQVHSRRDEERSRARMEAAQRLAQLGHWERNLGTGEMHWSDEMYRITGLNADLPASEELLHSVIHPDDRERVISIVHPAIEQIGTYELRYRIVQPSRAVRVVDETGEVTAGRDGRAQRVMGVVHDVTEQVATEEGLVASEARFRAVFETSANGRALVSRTKQIETANDRFWAIVGGRTDTAWDVTQVLDVVDEEERRELRRELESCFDGGVLTSIELQLGARTRNDGRERVLRVDLTPYRAHGQVDGVLVELRDITDRMETRRELELATDRLALAQEIAQTGHWEGDLETDAVSWSDETYRIFGLDPARSVATPELFLDVVHPEDRERVREAVKRTSRGAAPYELRHRIVRPDGEIRHVDEVGRIIRDEAGVARRVMGTIHDVTERVVAEEELAATTRRLELAQSQGRIGSYRRNLQTGEVYWSDERYRGFGYKPGEIEPTIENLYARIHPDDRERFRTEVQAAADGNGRFSLQIRIVRPDGVERVFWEYGELTRDADGRALSWDGTSQDVTELVVAEQALGETTSQLELAQSQARIGSFGRDIVTGVTHWSDELYRLLGYEPGTVKASDENFLDRIHRADVSRFRAEVWVAQGGTDRFSTRTRVVLADGKERILWLYAELTRDADGWPVRWDGAAQDVTDEVVAQQALAETTNRLELAQAQAHIGSYGQDVRSGEVYWSDELFRVFGHEPGAVEPSRETLHALIHPDDLETFQAEIAAATAGDGKIDRQFRIVRPDGMERTLWEHGLLSRDQNGRALSWDGTCQDVTELVEAQRALADSESRINLVFDTVSTGLALIGADRRTLVVNQACVDILGYSAEELASEPFDRFVHPDDLDLSLDRFRRRMLGEVVPEQQVDIRLIHADGHVIETDLRATEFRVGGEVVGVLAEFRDVTLEAGLHRQLFESAEQIDAILEATPDALIVADDEDVILRANAASEGVFEWEPDALVGQPVSVLVGGVDHAAHAAYVDYYKQTGKASTPEGLVVGNFRRVLGRRSNGAHFPAELAVAETGLSDGRKLFVAAIRDISEREAAEARLRELNSEVARRSQETQALVQQLLSAQEEERRTVAYDIHDGPAQQLAAAQMFLEAFVHDESISTSATPNLAKAKQYLEEGLTETRRIMSGLRPALLDDLGLGDALHQLLVELTDRANVELEYDASGLHGELPAAVNIALYRIAQEAVGNALKHAGSPCLEVRLESNADRVRLSVGDQGRGFDTAQVPSPSGGERFGLVGMRERVTLLGGTFEIESVVDAGTMVRLEIPLEDPSDE